MHHEGSAAGGPTQAYMLQNKTLTYAEGGRKSSGTFSAPPVYVVFVCLLAGKRLDCKVFRLGTPAITSSKVRGEQLLPGERLSQEIVCPARLVPGLRAPVVQWLQAGVCMRHVSGEWWHCGGCCVPSAPSLYGRHSDVI